VNGRRLFVRVRFIQRYIKKGKRMNAEMGITKKKPVPEPLPAAPRTADSLFQDLTVAKNQANRRAD
jgi:hypothetical protein